MLAQKFAVDWCETTLDFAPFFRVLAVARVLAAAVCPRVPVVVLSLSNALASLGLEQLSVSLSSMTASSSLQLVEIVPLSKLAERSCGCHEYRQYVASKASKQDVFGSPLHEPLR